jgi:hypothetical protein
VVVAVGLTANVPLGESDLNVPGVMAMMVAPVVAQVSLLLAPVSMLAGLAVNAVIVGGLVTVTVTAAWPEPADVVAVSV